MDKVENTILIRAEDKNEWERRTPLVPEDVSAFIAQTGNRVLVQESEKRCFHDRGYESVGAEICRNMTPGDIILGIKEIPKEKIVDQKVYLFFSHTIKGQADNMPLLRRIMESGSTLIDYEKMVDRQNRRLVYFGNYAGHAGAIDILSLMGEYWEHHGVPTPLLSCRRAHQYESLEKAMRQMEKVGDQIRIQGFPRIISPVSVGILGYGNVSQGAQEILDCLPVQRVDPEDLAEAVSKQPPLSRKIILTVFKEMHLVRPMGAEPFELNEYYQYPEKYRSRFDEYLPYISILLNAVYWEKKYPRFVTWDRLHRIRRKNGSTKLCGIADISCDVNGSIECNVKTTDSGQPAYLCDPSTKGIEDGHRGDGIVLLAVDNLPCELPLDASMFFSRHLSVWMPEIAQADYSADFESIALSPEIKGAVIVHKGRLTPSYQYLSSYLS
jgi:alpha-aminoadipic semialdehyde synthase